MFCFRISQRSMSKPLTSTDVLVSIREFGCCKKEQFQSNSQTDKPLLSCEFFALFAFSTGKQLCFFPRSREMMEWESHAAFLYCSF